MDYGLRIYAILNPIEFICDNIFLTKEVMKIASNLFFASMKWCDSTVVVLTPEMKVTCTNWNATHLKHINTCKR